MSLLFNHSQRIKYEVEKSTELMERLREYFLLSKKNQRKDIENPFHFVASKADISLCLVGEIGLGKYFAIQEWNSTLGEPQRAYIEAFSRCIDLLCNRGYTTLDFCIGINFKRGLNEERVALLIPDLTLNQKHTPIFKATKGPLEARIYNIGESDIITDVNERLRLNYGDPRFTAPEAMILINP